MKTTPAIRLASPADVPAALAVLREAAAWLVDTGRPLWEADELAVGPLEVAAGAGELFVADADGTMVSMMLVQRRDSLFWPDDPPGEASYVHRLAVARSAAGTGLATAMLHHALAVARERGNRFLRLDCVPRPKLVSLYERHGFARVDEGTFGCFRAVRFEKRL